jgi:hypothetical protein
MKNLHVLPTDREPIKGGLMLRHVWKNNSKLECISWWRYKDTIVIDDVLQYTTLNSSFRDITSSFKAQNIYITSNEEIKDGDYYLYLKDNKVYQFIRRDHTKLLRLDIQKKIILTTDQDLIKDGVQAIDDEFLEWFVNNPSCDKVELEEVLLGKVEGTSMVIFKYKINIPKEIGFKVENGKRTETFYQEPKQETLEEFAKQEAVKQYSEDTFGNLIVRKSIEKGAKWQRERMYSEEDMKLAYIQGCKNPSLHKTHEEKANEWFKQYKNK